MTVQRKEGLMNNNRLLKLALLWLVAVSLTLLYLFYDATEQISTLESQIEQRDSLIQKLSHSNDLIKEYFDVMDIPADEDGLVNCIVEHFKNEKIHLEGLKKQNDTAVHRPL